MRILPVGYPCNAGPGQDRPGREGPMESERIRIGMRAGGRMRWKRGVASFLALFLLSVTVAVATAAAAEDELVLLARRNGRPVIADFGLGLCRQCKKQAATLEEVRRAYGDRVVIRMVNVGKEARLVELYKVELIPNLVFLDATGKVALSRVGPLGFREIRDQLARMGVHPMQGEEKGR